MTSPAELDTEVSGLLDQLSATRRTLTHLSCEYARLDPHALGIDNLGDPIEPAAALAAAQAGLADIDKALGMAVDATYATMRHTSRLYER